MSNRKSNAENRLSFSITRWGGLIALLIVGLLIGYIAIYGMLRVQNDQSIPLLLRLVLILCLGLGGFFGFFFFMIKAIDGLPSKLQDVFTPILFIAPALAIILWTLVIPLLRSIGLSFFDAKGVSWVGLKNYFFALTDPSMQSAFRNNLLWLLLGGGGCVVIGLTIAFMTDYTDTRFSSIIRSIFFMPMAISMVGASIIWRFMYAFVPAGSQQIGVFNALIVAFGGEPQAFLMNRGINNLFLILVFIWTLTGLCLVIFSAAIQTIPDEIVEAARIDGANELQIISQISIPFLRGTIVTVTTLVIVLTLKVFDVVYTMTGGNYRTEVIANRFYTEMFRNYNSGRASAIVVVLFVLILPVVFYNLKDYREKFEKNL